MEVEHVLATHSVVSWADQVVGMKHEEVSWNEYRGPWSSAKTGYNYFARQQQDELETCLDDVKKMMIPWSKEKLWKNWAERHKYVEINEGMWQEPAEVVLTKENKWRTDAIVKKNIAPAWVVSATWPHAKDSKTWIG